MPRLAAKCTSKFGEALLCFRFALIRRGILSGHFDVSGISLKHTSESIEESSDSSHAVTTSTIGFLRAGWTAVAGPSASLAYLYQRSQEPFLNLSGVPLIPD
jgi:hypothetical protein